VIEGKESDGRRNSSNSSRRRIMEEIDGSRRK